MSAVEQVRHDRAPNDTSAPQEQRARELAFKPMFKEKLPEIGPAETWRMRAVAYPRRDESSDRNIDPSRLAKAHRNSSRWIETVLAADYQPEDAPNWLALRSNPFEADALYCGFVVRGRHIQVASLRYELHIRTALDDVDGPAEQQVVSRVLRLASEIFTVGVEDQSHYVLRRLGAFLTGVSLFSQIRMWQSFAFATDGVGVKFSFTKLDNFSSMKSERVTIDKTPWFGPYAEDAGAGQKDLAEDAGGEAGSDVERRVEVPTFMIAPVIAASAPLDIPTVGQTVDTGSPTPGGTLPFRGRPAAAPPALPVRGPLEGTGTLDARPDAGSTAATPFVVEAPGGRLTLEQYASLCVELAAAPRERDRILPKYGLDSARYKSVTDIFAQRFVAEPAVRDRWIKLCAELRRSS